MERHPGNLLPAGSGPLLPPDCPADQLEQGRATAQQRPKYPKRTILDLFSFVDWVMVLPGKLEREFDIAHTQFEAAQSMKYVTNIERRGRVEGRVEALRTAAMEILEARFGEVPYELREELQALGNETVLKRMPRLAAVVTGLDDFRRQLRQP
jgi:hypothetical protein